MSIKNYLIIIGICTTFCWVAWFMVLFLIDPLSTGLFGVSAFYVSLFFALIGTFSLGGFFLRKMKGHDDLWFRHLNTASRQSMVLSVLVITALILQSFTYLFWWNMLLLAFIGILVELFFMSYRRAS